MSDQEPQYFDDGSELWPLEGGGSVTFDADLQPVEAYDGNGDPIDPTGIMHPVVEEAQEYDGDEGGDPRLEELRAQIAELEQRVEEPLPVYDAGPRGPTDEEIQDRLEVTLGRLEAFLGRTTTARERNQLAERAIEDGSYDMLVAAGALRSEGMQLRDFHTGSEVRDHENRVAHATELLSDWDGSSPDPLTGQPQPVSEDGTYDLSTHEGRTQAAVDRMHGHDTSGGTYDSRTLEAEDQYE